MTIYVPHYSIVLSKNTILACIVWNNNKNCTHTGTSEIRQEVSGKTFSVAPWPVHVRLLGSHVVQLPAPSTIGKIFLPLPVSAHSECSQVFSNQSLHSSLWECVCACMHHAAIWVRSWSETIKLHNSYARLHVHVLCGWLVICIN